MSEMGFINMGTGELVLLIILPIAVLYFYCLFHAATNTSIPGTHRLLWFLIILSIPLLGSIAYWFMGRKAGMRI
jgi:hypothetical protein